VKRHAATRNADGFNVGNHELLVRSGEGWLSEETADSSERLHLRDVWIVDPLDGTREFVEGVTEWVVSVGFIRDGKPIAGGICNPQTGEMFLGSIETGLTYNHQPATLRQRNSLDGALVLASRSEFNRGEWEKYHNEPFTVRVVGSVAYKLAMVCRRPCRCDVVTRSQK
jgi:myo-inositol-1(or 4)-monophosphatase